MTMRTKEPRKRGKSLSAIISCRCCDLRVSSCNHTSFKLTYYRCLSHNDWMFVVTQKPTWITNNWFTQTMTSPITMFRSITRFCGTDIILQKISHIQIECGEHLHNVVSPTCNIVTDLNNTMPLDCTYESIIYMLMYVINDRDRWHPKPIAWTL